MSKTILEIVTRVEIKSDEALDENSIKGAVNWANSELLRGCFTTLDDSKPSEITVKLVQFKMDGKRVKLASFGTDSIQWQTPVTRKEPEFN